MQSLVSGTVKWDYRSYRNNAEKEYNYFFRALARELLQNANDAGSKKIEFFADKEAKTITCRDDGCGMTLDIITDKLLVIGGTYKKEGSVGGLGKAKELILFSWPKWEVHTLQYLVQGEGGDYTIFETDKYKGAKVTLHAPDESDIEYFIEGLNFIMQDTHIKPKVYLNNVRLYPKYRLGKPIRHIEGMGTLHCLKTHQGRKITEVTMPVLINGCWMFDRYLSSTPAYLALNIDSSEYDPQEILLSNRDSLRGDYGVKLDKVLSELQINKHTATRDLIKQPTVLNYIGPKGLLQTEKFREAVAAYKQKLPDLVAGYKDSQGEYVESPPPVIVNADNGQPMEAESEKFPKVKHFDHTMSVFIDPNCKWSKSVIKRFVASDKASIILNIWAMTLMQVLLDNEIEMAYGVGFVFDDDTEAMTKEISNHTHWLVNPRVVPPFGVQNKVVFTNWMRTTAVHEVTHIFAQYHDEDFVLKYAALESKTWASHREYSKIASWRPE